VISGTLSAAQKLAKPYLRRKKKALITSRVCKTTWWSLAIASFARSNWSLQVRAAGNPVLQGTVVFFSTGLRGVDPPCPLFPRFSQETM
jgi:hypothetical protein